MSHAITPIWWVACMASLNLEAMVQFAHRSSCIRRTSSTNIAVQPWCFNLGKHIVPPKCILQVTKWLHYDTPLWFRNRAREEPCCCGLPVSSFQPQHGLNTVQIFSVANAPMSVDLNCFLPRFIFICVPKEASFAFKCYRSTYWFISSIGFGNGLELILAPICEFIKDCYGISKSLVECY